jgi:hypothetical protein
MFEATLRLTGMPCPPTLCASSAGARATPLRPPRRHPALGGESAWTHLTRYSKVDDSTVPGIGDEDLALRVHRDPQRKPERAAAVEPELGPKRAGRGTR